MPLQWGNSNARSNTLAGQFPQFQINAADVRRGAVIVNAMSPSGKTHRMTVEDKNGVYTANFTPTEVGDWNVAILYDGQHIQGSPFDVRVYDASRVRVLDLRGGAVGKKFAFTVKADGAGDGKLDVNIVHNGVTVPASIIPTNPALQEYEVDFTPPGSGMYTIRVFFAGMEVPNSPFKLEIIDSSSVTASGRGLTSAAINTNAEFLISTGTISKDGDLRVEISAPSGAKIANQVVDNNNGTFTVRYVASEIGEYIIDVYFYGKPIKGSPFRVQAYDLSSIHVTIPSNGMVERLVEFDINAARAGSGNLEIMVNDGKIPCSVQNRGNRQFHASFMPRAPGTHYVMMKFNGQPLYNSPWRVDIRSAATMTAGGSGLQMVPVGVRANFEVKTGGIDHGDIRIAITAPSGRLVPSTIKNLGRGDYNVEYMPMEVGNHLVDVTYDNMALPGSPFTSKAYDVNAIVIQPIAGGSVGNHVEFTVDVTQAGEGQLEIMVDGGTIPNHVSMIRKGVFKVDFVPKEARAHKVDIRFNGMNAPSSPFMVPVMDSNRITAIGDGLRHSSVNKQAYFRVNTAAAGAADLAVKVTSPSSRLVTPAVIGSPESGYDVDFTPTEVGSYKIEIEYGGIPIPGSPFYCKVYDPSKVKAREVRDGIVGVKSAFLVDIDDSGEGSLEISITGPSGGNLHNQVHQLQAGRFEVSYSPVETGTHLANILFNKQHVPGSPFKFTVIDASQVTATGEGLGLVPCNRSTGFAVHAPGARAQDLTVNILGPDGRQVLTRVYESRMDMGQYTVEYTPIIPGEHKIELRYFGQVVPGSPFTAKAWDASKVAVSNISPGRIGKPSHFSIDASRAGAGNLEIVVSSGGDNVPNFVKAEGNARFEVSFTPNTIDTHSIHIKFNGELVPGSPFYHAIIDGSRATASGPGLKMVPTNKPTYFDVYTQGVSGDAPLQVNVTGIQGRPVPSRISGSSQTGFRVEYVPMEVGGHLVRVLYADVDIQGSPFTVDVYDSSQVKVGTIPQGVLGQPVKFEVDTSSAGKGTLMAEIKGHSTAPPSDVVARTTHRYDVSFVPREVVPHYIHLAFNGEQVPGSPFLAQVFDWNNMSVNWEAARLAPVNKPVVLTLDPHGAPEANIEASIADPYGKDVPVQVSRQGATYQVIFTPLTVGPHSITIKYGGQQVPGSPGSCNVHDAGRVRLTDVTQPGIVRQEMGFTVDTTEAGIGDLDVELFSQGGQPVATHRQQLDQFRHRFTFTPNSPVNHTAEISFNYQRIPGVPLVMGVFDWNNINVNWESARLVPVNKRVTVDIDPRGAPAADVIARLTDPSGQEVTTSVRHHGDLYQVMFTPVVIGPHIMTLTYGGQVVQGSPFTLNAYDAARVRIADASHMGALRQEMGLTVDTSKAGEGDLLVEVKCQGRLLITKEMTMTQHNRRFTFVPMLADVHEVTVMFNKDHVPGSPVEMLVFDPNNIKVIWDAVRQVPVTKPVTFVLDPCGIPDAPVDATIIDPDGREILGQISKDGSLYKLTFIPMSVGAHKVTFHYAGQVVPGSPFVCLAFDPSEVKVTDITEQVILGQECHFTVDTTSSGYTGEIEVEVMCDGHSVPLRYFPLDYNRRKFMFTPLVAMEHHIDVVLFEQRPPGVPFSVRVIDFGQLVVDYSEARSIPLGALAHILIDPRGYPDASVEAKCTDDKNTEIPLVVQRIEGKFRIELNPQTTGSYLFTLSFCGQPVPGSPHKCSVYSADKVKVIDLKQYTNVAEEVTFTVDLAEVGDGELTLQVLSQGQTLPLRHNPIHKHRHQFTFVPQETQDHEVHVQFNKEELPNSPYIVHVFDVRNVTTDWDAMRPVPVNKVVVMEIDPRGLPESSIDVSIIDPESHRIQPRVYPDGSMYKVEFTPTIVGVHTINVLYGGQPVPGSPFLCNAYDTTQVHLKGVSSSALVGQEAAFSVNVQDAGQGLLGAEIFCDGHSVPFQHQQADQVTHRFSFVPMATGQHQIQIHYNGETVMGSPFNIMAYDMNKMSINAEAIRLIPVNQPISVELDPRGVPDARVEVKVTDLSGMEIPYQINKRGSLFLIEFVPRKVGLCTVSLWCGGQAVPGSPIQCNVYDVGRIQVTDITQQGLVREEMGFTVQMGDAGQGELEAELTNSGAPVQMTQRRLNQNAIRFVFIPSAPGDHIATVKFNNMIVANTPFTMHVLDPSVKITVRTDPSMRNLPAGATGASYIQAQGGARIKINDMAVHVLGPNGQLVPAQIVQQTDGDYKVEYSSRFTGRHTVEILYNNQAIMGSPFFVEIYDPNKVVVTGRPEGTVGVPMSIDIITREAGKANLALKIASPTGRNVPYNINKMADGSGEVVEYVPMEPGPHQIYITYGDLDVAGTPITQNISDTPSSVSASGSGLHSALKGQRAAFSIDTKGRRGNLEVHVKGTHTIAQVQLDPDGNQFKASYVPVEAGPFYVTILWNGQQIPNSPFLVNVVEPIDVNTIMPIGGWNSILDSEGKMFLKTNVINTIDFDTSRAGPCMMTATVESPARDVIPVTVEKTGNGAQTTLSFLPKVIGMYRIRIFCNDTALPRSPIAALASDPIDHEKVVLTGRGLQDAFVNQEAEFVIDGTESGPGEPSVKLTGVKQDIHVRLEPIASRSNMYKAMYVPVVPGAYLLSIMWANRLVRGSPFKVNVKSGANASKVNVNTEGFKQSMFGREIKAVIDTRRAGPGELTAHCMGPDKVAYCELLDHRDGTFTLNIRPQEAGKHILQVKYGGEHVPGSPFLLRVAGPPDASKVRVTGPGVEHGILANFQSRFITETRGAGAGQLTVRIRGPKGAFRVEMQRESQKDRTILCRYDPTEVGTYMIQVKWSGEHVPGSPFQIQIFDTMSELQDFQVTNPGKQLPRVVDDGHWSENL